MSGWFNSRLERVTGIEPGGKTAQQGIDALEAGLQ
jgi:hypothetical protein